LRSRIWWEILIRQRFTASASKPIFAGFMSMYTVEEEEGEENND
jgi:hypothetical protein